MKLIVSKSFLVVSIVCLTTSLLKSQTIVNSNGDSLVTISASGEIKDFNNGTTIGSISSNQIKDASGTVLGSINGVNIKDQQGTTIYKTQSNGQLLQLKNTSDVEIGRINSGFMLTVNDNLVLNVSEPLDPEVLAGYYFFFYKN